MSSSDDLPDESSTDCTDSELGRVWLKKLKILRKKADWEDEIDRQEFLDDIFEICRDWEGKLPNLRVIFRSREIDQLLTEFAKDKNHDALNFRAGLSIGFVASTGYKDKPILGKDGKPSPYRTTAVHHAVRRKNACEMMMVTQDLFKIYDRFDVNYTDEYGLTHFHAACMADCKDVVEKFLEFGLDPNYYPQESIDPPLHLALAWGRKEVTSLLLQKGADPNLANSDKNHQLVKVDAVDKLGRTPLQWAVASLVPNTVDVLLDRGANLSNFIFPTASYFGERSNPTDDWLYESSKIVIAVGALAVVEYLEKRGYKLDRSDASTIMNLFVRHRVFEKSVDLEKCWYDDEKFASKAKKLMMNPSLSLYDFIRLPPEKAQKILTSVEYIKFLPKFRNCCYIPPKPKQGCIEHLCEVLSRGFLQRCALEFFFEVKVIYKLKSEDLLNICLAGSS
ncbi:uncharacterized protein LOC106656560 [Trichogramma pretiosum]|uniref:uncharacterized protein LOC106656560 n=1 Tax=Trichogramma pretiosum TaxID=7493 RepID=UPI0006C96D58|nr:uncharacterized protein LOC106656560 [Trichogramma pretiosum]